MKFEEKFIAFVDILGFKDMVEKSESGQGIPLAEIMGYLSKLGTKHDELKFSSYGPTFCPDSRCVEKGLDFKVTQISDCVIVSSEISPAGIINLTGHCWNSVFELLLKGVLCRGYITKGLIYHQDNQVIGTGYQRAFDNESGVSAFKMEADERGTPFVEIDPIVCEYIKVSTDRCVNKVFNRMVKTEKDVTAIFPFEMLAHSFVIGGEDGFNQNKEKEANEEVRSMLRNLSTIIDKQIDKNNVKALKKGRHYLHAIKEQLKVADSTDEFIELLSQPFPRR